MPDLLDEISTYLDDAKSTIATSGAIQAGEKIGSDVYVEAVHDASDAFGAPAGAAEAASGLGLFGWLGVIGNYVAIISQMLWLRSWLLQLGTHLPGMFNIRGLWNAGVVSLFFGPIDVIGQFIDETPTHVSKAVQGHVGFLNWALPLTDPFQQFLQSVGAGTIDLTGLYNELHTDEQRITQLQGRVDWIESHMGVPAPTPAPNLVPLQEQINALQSRLAAAEQRVLDLRQTVNHQEGVIMVLVNDFAVIQAELQGVRSTVTSWPEIQRTLELQVSTLTTAQSDTNARVGEQGDFLALLAPLAILALAPTRGIENLRKLEDNPCQCPQLPGLPGDMAAMLALYEFVTHG